MDDTRTGRRERRRRKAVAGTRTTGNEFEKTIENFEFSIDPRVVHSFDKLVRRDTFSVLRSKSDFQVGKGDDDGRSPESPGNDSGDSRNLTYSIGNVSGNSVNCTYDVEKPPDWDDIRPVPAPRKRKPGSSEVEKISSDTDRDVTEIDLDDPRPKSPTPDLKTSPESAPPVPKPRKTVNNIQKPESNLEESKNEESPIKNSKMESYEEKTAEENPETEADSLTRNELPLIANLQEEAKAEESKRKYKKQRKIIGDLLDRKGKKKKSRTFSSLMKLEKKKMPKLSSALKDIKEGKEEEEFQTPQVESVQSGQIYVQGKSGFRVRELDEVLGHGRNSEKGGNGGMTAGSAVHTAILLQKYWSRAMTYFHGVLAGFGFSHAATVTAIMIHCNYEPRDFVGVYSCLSLKIHYAFYTLTALCIVSCFDRIDVGHVNRKHWAASWKAPSAWIVLVSYAVGFALTLAGQTTEARFDALIGGNETEIWNGQSRTEIQAHLLQWYHGAWARDALVLFAWLVIAMTKFEDHLLSHVRNMARCVGEEKSLRQNA